MVKILGIDDNSELFSLFVTFLFSIALFMGTAMLYMKVMDDKEQKELEELEKLENSSLTAKKDD
jgi:flagellar biogenesis protein FliO